MTSSSHQGLERIARRVPVPQPAYERLLRRRDRKRRNQRIGAGALAIALSLLGLMVLTRAFTTAERPANEPAPKPPGIFSEVGGWIVYGPLLGDKCEPAPCGHEEGIWAVDPTRLFEPDAQIELSPDGGTPVAWSSDGSKLLISRRNPQRAPGQAWFGNNLFVLNADGIETRLTNGDDYLTGGSFSPDGTGVVYATTWPALAGPSRIYVVDAAGGTPQALLTGNDLNAPTFSPDGSKIAYFAWEGTRYELRVMDADGNGSGALSDDVFNDTGDSLGLVWSPDGTRLAIDYGGDIYTVGADGSDLTLVVPEAGNPNWSPDGSLLAYDNEDVSYPPGPRLAIADVSGKKTKESANARSGPWNPLVQPSQEVVQVPATSERVGFVGLPPEGAHPSTPPSGELVFSSNGFGPGDVRVDLYVYADGSMIWQKWSIQSSIPVGVPEGANAFTTGYLQQRLTTEGVELLRSRILSTSLFDHNMQLRSGSFHPAFTIGVRNGDRLVIVSASEELDTKDQTADFAEETPTMARALVGLEMLLADPAAWLPTTAWADREIRAYVPSWFSGGFDRRVPSPSELPPPADKLLFDDCNVFTIEEARTLSKALEDAGITPSITGDGQLAYEIFAADPTHPAYLHFWSVLPDQGSSPGWEGWTETPC